MLDSQKTTEENINNMAEQFIDLPKGIEKLQ